MSNIDNEANTGEITMSEAIKKVRMTIKYILSKWLIIGFISVFFGLLGVAYAYFKKPIYIAELSFVTEGESQGGIGIYAGLANQFGLDIGGGSAFEGENLIEVLKSRSLIEKTLLTRITDTSSQLMVDYYLMVNSNNDNNIRQVKGNFEEGKLINDRATDSLLKKIYKQVEKELEISKPDKRVEKIVLKVETGDEFFAKRFAELLMLNATQYFVEIKSKKSRDNLAILQRQTDSVKQELYGNIGQSALIQDLNVNPTRQIVRVGSQKNQLSIQTNAALYAELIKNLELAKISLRKEIPLVQIIDYPKFPLEKRKPGRLMTGLVFSFIGGAITVLFLMTRKWYLNIIKTNK